MRGVRFPDSTLCNTALQFVRQFATRAGGSTTAPTAAGATQTLPRFYKAAGIQAAPEVELYFCCTRT